CRRSVAPTPAALAACGFARTVIGAFGDTGGLEPARTLSSCPAHTPCPLGGRSAPDRDGGPCAGCAPRLPGLCAPLGDDPTFATRRQNCQPSQLRRGFSYSRTLLTAWSEIGLKADGLHRQAPGTGLERRSVRRTRFTAY